MHAQHQALYRFFQGKLIWLLPYLQKSLSCILGSSVGVPVLSFGSRLLPSSFIMFELGFNIHVTGSWFPSPVVVYISSLIWSARYAVAVCLLCCRSCFLFCLLSLNQVILSLVLACKKRSNNWYSINDATSYLHRWYQKLCALQNNSQLFSISHKKENKFPYPTQPMEWYLDNHESTSIHDCLSFLRKNPILIFYPRQ